jgi:hypothetical protein
MQTNMWRWGGYWASSHPTEMLILRHRDQQEKNLIQWYTDLLIWLYSVLYIVIAYPLADQKKNIYVKTGIEPIS